LKKIFKIYAVSIVLFFGYTSISIYFYEGDISNIERVLLSISTFVVPVIFFVWFPMRFYCRYSKNKTT